MKESKSFPLFILASKTLYFDTEWSCTKSMMCQFFRNVMSFRMVNNYGRFGGQFCFHLQGQNF
jgi:hypothetical protein